jgi:acyl carrier protein
LILEFEKEFGISISDEIAEKIVTVGQSIVQIYEILNND